MTIPTRNGKVLMNEGKVVTNSDCCCCGELETKGITLAVSGFASNGCLDNVVNSQQADHLVGLNGMFTPTFYGSGGGSWTWTQVLGSFDDEGYPEGACGGTPTPANKTVVAYITCTGNRLFQITILTQTTGSAPGGSDQRWDDAGMVLGTPYALPGGAGYSPWPWLTNPTITIAEAS